MAIQSSLVTSTPGLEPLAGSETIPLAQMAAGNPWLSLDKAQVPGSRYIAFNTRMAPFDKPLVRKAFAAAIHRQGVATFAGQLYQETYLPATTFTPPSVLGRDLYREVGVNYNLEQARKALYDAGFPNGEGLPAVSLSISNCQDSTSSSVQIANYLVDMWSQAGIKVDVNCINDPAKFSQSVNSGALQLYTAGWAADYNDPDNFLKAVFYSSSAENHGYFADAEFDHIVDKAAGLSDPAERQRLYIQAEGILCGDQAALIPLYFSTIDTNQDVSTQIPSGTSDTKFDDDFSSPTSGWVTGTFDGYIVTYEDSGYSIQVNRTKYYTWSKPPITYKTTTMEFDARVPDSHKNGDYGYLGAICRFQDADNFYYVDIDTKGKTTKFGMNKNGQFESLTEPKTAVGMKPQAYDTNHFLLDCTGQEINLFINDQVQETISNNSLPTDGQMAIYVGTYDKIAANGFKMIFDNFSIWKPVQ
jgi:hypothetical protein